MDSQEVRASLEECLEAADADQPDPAWLDGAAKLHYRSCRDSLCPELASLLQEAEDMKWPFVPEKWQYKDSVSAHDKTNLSDLISKHLPQLLALLKASILAQEARSALAVVFLVDRFLYWIDESSRLLKIAKLLHMRHHDNAIAPQLVIRQARVYLNSGRLQKAEFILSSLINNSGSTGCWTYQSQSDRVLVQSVCLQVRGMALQKLGLWREAAELIWSSVVGYYALPQPDKKGIGTSLGILANILVSMNDEDFHTFRTNPDIDFSFLGDGSNRLLSAAQAAKMAVVYSQYTSLYVLTNVVTQGTCLLSYSFSVQCPASQRQTFLLQAKEAFAIGLLTKAEGESVSSQQELHTFLKAAYSLTVAQKWLGAPPGVVDQAGEACQKALERFYQYCHAKAKEKDHLCGQIMHLVAQVKRLLGVEPFPNSDKRSFIPDSYRSVKDVSVNFTLESFSKVTQRFQKYHQSLWETTKKKSQSGIEDEKDGGSLCLTAIGTTIASLHTECTTQAFTPEAKKQQEQGSTSAFKSLQKPELGSTLGSDDDLGSSWDKFSLSGSGSLGVTGQGGQSGQSCATTEDDDNDGLDGLLQSGNGNRKQNSQGRDLGVSSQAVPSPSQPGSSHSDADSFQVIQAGVEALEPNEVQKVAPKQSVDEGAVQSLSQLALITSSSSLGDSFGSRSSWEKISADPKSSALGKPRMGKPSKTGTDPSSSDESFFLQETLDSASSFSSLEDVWENQLSGWKSSAKPQPAESLNAQQNMEPEAPFKPATSKAASDQDALTETSTDSSFEMLEPDQSGQRHTNEVGVVPPKRSPLCHSCVNSNTFTDVGSGRQFVLSQQDYQDLLAGVCHECLLKRFHSEETQFKLKAHRVASRALLLKFSKATELWTAKETCMFIGDPMTGCVEGKQRAPIWVQFLHQEERLSSYVAKDYLKPKEIQFHLKDVERQMTAQHYVTEFNKSLYDRDVMAQIFFIPSEALLVLEGDQIVGCVSVEPYMLGDFVKLTNNGRKTDPHFKATDYGLAFGHFTYLHSGGQEIVVDLQGWVTADGEGLTYLTDPQIHSTRTPKGPSNFAEGGIRAFMEAQHGPECNRICQLLDLPPLGR